MRLAILLLLALPLQATNLITNGDFESGSTAGWQIIAGSGGNIIGACNNPFAAQITGTGCLNNLSPSFGSYAAYASSSFPGTPNALGSLSNVMSQEVLLPNPIQQAILGWSDAAVWTGSGNNFPVSIAIEIFSGQTFLGFRRDLFFPTSTGQFTWTNHSWDVTSLVQAWAGQPFRVQFVASVSYDNQNAPNNLANLNVGFDNISFDVTVPEPSTITMAATVLIALALKLRR